VKLVGDLPIYVEYDSVDVWVNPELFKLDDDLKPTGVSGVPPDYFSTTGQLWNNPVYNWTEMEKTGFHWWLKRMFITMNRFDLVRIDHFRGLVQYWEVPAGETTAINGSWQDVPVRPFLKALNKHFPAMPFIAEDLGIITPDVREVMNEFKLPGMKVLLFAFGEDNPDNPYQPHNIEQNSVVYTGTHDVNTIRGWYENEATEQDKIRLNEYFGNTFNSQTIVDELIRAAMMSSAETAIIPLQDWLGLGADARINVPNVPDGNWRWRCTPEQYSCIPWDIMRQIVRRYARSCYLEQQ
jgi:4-alpha-glucanotransferase